MSDDKPIIEPVVKKKRIRKKPAPSGIKGKRPSGMPNGRPTLYSQQLSKKICLAVATSIDPLKKICEDHPEFPVARMIYEWRFKHKEFADAFNEAKVLQAQLFAESIDEESQGINTYIDKEGNVRYDSAHVAAKRLLTDNRRWIAQSIASKIYNKPNTLEIKTDTDEKDAIIKKLREELDKANKKDF
jgi:hypothetical protein